MILRAFFWRMKQATPLGVVDAMRQKKAPKASGSPRRKIYGELLLYTNNLKNWFSASVKAPRLNDRKRLHISNMEPFAIVQPRGFDAAENPILEVVCVYQRAWRVPLLFPP